MTPDQIEAAAELKQRLLEHHEAKMRLGTAAKRVREAFRKPDLPALLRRQIG